MALADELLLRKGAVNVSVEPKVHPSSRKVAVAYAPFIMMRNVVGFGFLHCFNLAKNEMDRI